MIQDLASEVLPESIDADICVVGAGPVGITVALELARRGQRVALLESGGPRLEAAAQDLNRATNVGRNHNGINLGRYRALGGTSTQWGGQILPFDPIDFERRDWVDGSGWPIEYREVERHYGAALEYEGLGACLKDDRQVWSAAGLATPDLGDGLEWHFSRWCPRPDFAQLHGKEIAQSATLHCVLHATVTALSCEGERIRAALARSLGGRRLRVRAPRFVFCVGAVETARLLLQPLENGDAAPWTKASDAVGRYFQDHPTFECADVRPRDPAALHDRMDVVFTGGLKYQPRFHLSAERQRQLRCLNAGGLVSFKTEISALVLGQVRAAAKRVLKGPFSLGAFSVAARNAIAGGPLIMRQAWRYLVHRRAYNPSDRGFRLLCFVEQRPDPASRITLSREQDPLGTYRAQLDWRIGQPEVDAVAAFATTVREDFESSGFAEVVIDRPIADRDPGAHNLCWDNFHDMGTARMATSPETGVVDRDLRMFGTENGYVCSTAVFPTGSFANPTHTAIALGIRLAAHLDAGRQD